MNEELEIRLEKIERRQRRLIQNIDELEEWLSAVCCKAEVNKRVLLSSKHKEEIQDIMDEEEEKVMEEQS